MNGQQKSQIEKYRIVGTGLPDADLAGVSTERFFTPAQYQRDVDYYRAQRIAESMLDAELISLSQFDDLTKLNLKSFSPFLAELFPNTVDNSSKQR